ncbi:hypothetical protein AB836_00340 [Rickettsiales bacterium (ex Bugula neritina AB1)]|nr:hypothetical protein AB836_00340 [Rickettsiales bacterium (ex Bugula neritina AB1)]
MRRKRVLSSHKRRTPDIKYQSESIGKFINMLMIGGNKNTIEKFVYPALDKISSELKETNTVLVFEKIIDNISPSHELRYRRVGSSNYGIPKEIKNNNRKVFKGVKILIDAIRKISGKSLYDKVYKILIDTYHNTGEAVKIKNQQMSNVNSNFANAHFRWGK